MPRFHTQETGKMQITVDREDLAAWESIKQKAKALRIRIDISEDFTQWLRAVIRKADRYLEEEEKRRKEGQKEERREEKKTEPKERKADAGLPSN
ncbi:MAG TPA: hypothetical protein PLG94_11185 [Smithellaceae bacterium]|nr:hypothetical protein [Smithellaceae bacterium]